MTPPPSSPDTGAPLPCPFCGGEGVLHSVPSGMAWVSCEECLIAAPSDLGETLATKRWNRRAGLAQARGTPISESVRIELDSCRHAVSTIESKRTGSKTQDHNYSFYKGKVAGLEYALAAWPLNASAATPPNREAAFNAVSEILCGKSICTNVGDWLCPTDIDCANEMIAEIVVKVTDLASPHSRPQQAPE